MLFLSISDLLLPCRNWGAFLPQAPVGSCFAQLKRWKSLLVCTSDFDESITLSPTVLRWSFSRTMSTVRWGREIIMDLHFDGGRVCRIICFYMMKKMRSSSHLFEEALVLLMVYCFLLKKLNFHWYTTAGFRFILCFNFARSKTMSGDMVKFFHMKISVIYLTISDLQMKWMKRNRLLMSGRKRRRKLSPRSNSFLMAFFPKICVTLI